MQTRNHLFSAEDMSHVKMLQALYQRLIYNLQHVVIVSHL